MRSTEIVNKNKRIASVLNANIAVNAVLLLELVTLLVPDGLSHVAPMISKLVYTYTQTAAYGIIALHFIIVARRRSEVSGAFKVALALVLCSGLITVIRKGSLAEWWSVYSICLFSCMMVEIYKDKLDTLMLVALVILEFWIYINTLAMIVYPNGMYYLESNHTFNNWLLGYKSSLQYYFLPAICFTMINLRYRKQRMRSLLLMAVCLYQSFYVGNAMLIVGLTIIVVVYFTPMINLVHLFNIRNYVIAALAFGFVAVFATSLLFTLDVSANLMQALGKSVLLSNRASIIWPITLSYIANNWLIGYGVLSTSTRVSMYGGGLAYIHAHNQILELLFVGGVVLLAIFVLLVVLVSIKLMKTKRLESSKIFSLSLFALFIMLSVEVFTRRIACPIWLLFFLSYYSHELDAQFKSRADCRLDPRRAESESM